MAILHKFCCLCTVRSGAMFSGFYSVVSTLIFIGMILLRFVGYNLIDQSSVHETAFYAVMAVDGCLSVVSVILIIAVFKDMPRLMIPWLVTALTSIITVTIMMIWVTVIQIQLYRDVVEVLHTWDIVILVYHTLNSIFELYCLGCVTSQVMDLLKGKGTAEWYRHRRFTRMLHAHRHLSRLASNDFIISADDDVFPDDIDNIGIPQTTPTIPPPYSQAPPDYSTMPRPGENQSRPTANQVLTPQTEAQGQDNPALTSDNDQQTSDPHNTRNGSQAHRRTGQERNRHTCQHRPRDGRRHRHHRHRPRQREGERVHMGPVPVLLDPMMAARLYSEFLPGIQPNTGPLRQDHTARHITTQPRPDNVQTVEPPADYDSNSALPDNVESVASDAV